LRAGLIDRLTVTVIPILLGEGRRLFGALAGDINLTLEENRAYDFGFTQTTYRVCPASP
jgi:dihydrofolate reductase